MALIMVPHDRSANNDDTAANRRFCIGSRPCGGGIAMACTSFEFVEDDPLQCVHCARRLRRALQRVPGIEAVTISIEKQWIAIAFNRVLLDSDTLGEKLADLGHVVRPAARAASKAWAGTLAVRGAS